MGLFSKLFGRAEGGTTPQSTVVEVESGGISELGRWSGNIYESDVVRSAIWTNAKNAGKLNPKHIRKSGEKYDIFPAPRVKRILTRPNKYMSMSVFLNKMLVQCQKKNNAFALIKFDMDGWVEGLYPVTYNKVEAVESHGFYFVKFYLAEGKQMTVPYEEVITSSGLIFEVIAAHTSNAAYPVETTFAYYRLIELAHAGTREDPIPYPEAAGILVRVVNGKYYGYKGAVYLAKADMPDCVYPPDTAGMWQWEKVKK